MDTIKLLITGNTSQFYSECYVHWVATTHQPQLRSKLQTLKPPQIWDNTLTRQPTNPIDTTLLSYSYPKHTPCRDRNHRYHQQQDAALDQHQQTGDEAIAHQQHPEEAENAALQQITMAAPASPKLPSLESLRSTHSSPISHTIDPPQPHKSQPQTRAPQHPRHQHRLDQEEVFSNPKPPTQQQVPHTRHRLKNSHKSSNPTTTHTI